MNILFFAPNFEEANAKKILSTVNSSLPEAETKLFAEIQALFDWLRIPPRSFFVAILIPDSYQALTELVFMKDLFMDRKIILSLPDDTPRSIAMSHKLNPLYYLSASDNGNGLMPVLEKLLSNGHESIKT